ncbi:hypothetical protein PV325_006399, partial [Microctonus aethiopoides]
HYHIFVGDLSPEIETQTLREAFAPFGGTLPVALGLETLSGLKSYTPGQPSFSLVEPTPAMGNSHRYPTTTTTTTTTTFAICTTTSATSIFHPPSLRSNVP